MVVVERIRGSCMDIEARSRGKEVVVVVSGGWLSKV